MIPFYFYITTEAPIPNTVISIKCTFLTLITTTSLSRPNNSQVTNIFSFSSSLHCCLFQISLPPRLILSCSQINRYPEKCFLQVKIQVQYAFPCALKHELLKAWGVAGKGWKMRGRLWVLVIELVGLSVLLVGPPSTAAKYHCLSSSCDSAYEVKLPDKICWGGRGGSASF